MAEYPVQLYSELWIPDQHNVNSIHVWSHASPL